MIKTLSAEELQAVDEFCNKYFIPAFKAVCEDMEEEQVWANPAQGSAKE